MRKSSWPIVPLLEICNPKQWPTIAQTAFLPSGYPVYGANGRIGYYSKFNHEKPTVLITCRGATCGTVKVCAPRSYVTGNAMALDDVDESRVSLSYLVYALRNGNLAKAISGTAQPQITRQGLAAISVPTPSLEEQQRIAEILDRADELRAKRRAALVQLDTLTQSTFLDLFGNAADNPRQFPVRRFADVCERIFKGAFDLKASAYCNDGIPFIRIADIQQNTIDLSHAVFIDERTHSQYSRSELVSGDIVFCKVGTIDRIAVIPSEIPRCNISQNNVGVKLIPDLVHPSYALFLLTSPYALGRIRASSKKAVQDKLVLEELRKLPFMLPPLTQQHDFADRIAAIEKLRSTHRALTWRRTPCVR